MTDIKPAAWYDDYLEIHYGPTQPVFTVTGWKPLYPESALAEAVERGRIAGLREALRVSEQAVSDLAQIYGLLQEGKVDEAEDYCWCAAEGYTQDIATFSETPGASAITRAAEGK